MFDHQQFSRFMKVALADYFSGSTVNSEGFEKWLSDLSVFDLTSLSGDKERKAFWINVYNGLTNYFIISNGLKKSVWEVPDFFSGLAVRIGEFTFSLDDIEHGILRQNGERKKGKPRQFDTDDSRLLLMVKAFDSRIHFALNCGSVSCPPIAFYSTQNIDAELSLAEESFASQEFLIDHENRTIHCSEIFIWYKADFPNTYLNSPELRTYKVVPIPYQWTIH